MNTKTLVVVGNGITSQTFCRWLTERPTAARGSIVVFGEEPQPAYDRVHLTDLFRDKRPGDLELASRAWYAAREITLRTGERISAIDRWQRVVRTAAGDEIAYDQLVLATGSRPLVPKIPGVNLPGVFVYRTIQDVESISRYARQARTAAVIGGGLLGLEAAQALRDMHLVTHVVEMAPSLMPRQLDRECAEDLKRRVERTGVQIHLTKRTQAIARHGDYLILEFDSGESLAVDMVVISAGIQPRDELARAAELKIGPRGGIVVDDRLQSSAPHIFAIGECACHRGVVYGLVGPCQQMARVLASRLQGQEQRFHVGDQSAKLKLMGVDVATFGEPIGQSDITEVISAKLNGDATRKLLLRDGRLVGAMGVGDWPEADRIRAAVWAAKRPWSWQLARFRRTGRLWSEGSDLEVHQWPPEALVCSCVQVPRSDLTTACQGGCTTVEQLTAHTGAGSVCGSCRPLLAQMLGISKDSADVIAGRRGLLAASCAAVLLLGCAGFAGPIDFSASVQGTRRRIDFLWRDGFWKQVSGYSLLGVTLAALLLSVRKRLRWFSCGAFGNWRMAHASLGVATLAGLLMHTGFHMGSNLNYWLMVCFLGTNLLGGFTGMATSLESKVSGGTALLLRQWRPRMTLLHILFFWPLPALIAVHVFSIYYY